MLEVTVWQENTCYHQQYHYHIKTSLNTENVISAAWPLTSGPILVPLRVVSVQSGLSSDHTRAASLPLSVTVPPPLAFSLCPVCYHPISLFWWTMRVVMAVPPFLPSSRVIGLLVRGAGLVVVPVTLPVTTLAPVPPPLFSLGAISVVISAPAVMDVVPSAPAVAPVSAVPVSVSVAVMLPGVRVEAVSRPVPCRLLPSSLRRPAGFVSVPGFHHERPVQVSLHVGMQVEGGGHAEAFLWVELIEQGLTARPHVVSPQLVGPLLPHWHGFWCPLLLLTAHRNQTHRKCQAQRHRHIFCSSRLYDFFFPCEFWVNITKAPSIATQSSTHQALSKVR